MRWRSWWIYPVWIVFSAALFFAFRYSNDPSRPHGRILSDEAAVRAVSMLKASDPVRFASYVAVHVAWAGGGEVGGRGKWIVLCDRVPHTALRQAVVVELEGIDGRLLTIRKPVN